MDHFARPQSLTTSNSTGQSYTGPLVIVTTLFFMWGFLTSLNDVLIPHLKAVYTLTYVQAMMVQFCFFGAYFFASLPAGILIKHIGYQKGVVIGLAIAAGGCALFYPAANGGYGIFLMAFFMLACGITTLQVAANPYVTVLGAPQTASSRLTLTQAFNSLGTTIAPALGGMLILESGVLNVEDLAKLPLAAQVAYGAEQAASVQGPYLFLAAALLAIATLFALTRLPKIEHAAAGTESDMAWGRSLFAHPHLVFGVLGIFAYVGAEVSIGSFLINFIGEPNVAALPAAQAAQYVSYYWGGAMLGRFLGFALMRTISPGKALAVNASLSILLIAIAMFSHGPLAMWSMIAVGLCNSIMFPAIFSMALTRLGAQTGRASGLLCMAIVGGAVVPFIQGFFADVLGVQMSFFVPAVCYVYILYFGAKFAGLYQTGS